jgi:ATP-dependent RNA helicase DDX21
MGTISRISAKKQQFMMFSATIPPWIKDVSSEYLDDEHVFVDLAKDLKNKTPQNVNHLAINVPIDNRADTLADVLKCYGGTNGKTIVFTATKLDASRITSHEKIKDQAEYLHGDIPQRMREITLK